MDQFVGKKYRLKTSENFEEYLKFIDIGLISRKTACAVTPIAILMKNEDGSYTFSMGTTFKTVAFTFRPGEEFVEQRADGVKTRCVIHFEGNEMIQIQTEDNGRVSRHVRTFKPDSLVVTTKAEGWDGTCVRTYELVQ